MTTDVVIVTIAGIVGIIFTYWFFLMKKDSEVIVSDSVDITVKGGYTPSTIVIANRKPTRINFTRKDPSPCLEEVVLSYFNIRKTLPIDQSVTVELTPTKPGEFPFSCGMSMFHGKIIVR